VGEYVASERGSGRLTRRDAPVAHEPEARQEVRPRDLVGELGILSALSASLSDQITRVRSSALVLEPLRRGCRARARL